MLRISLPSKTVFPKIRFAVAAFALIFLSILILLFPRPQKTSPSLGFEIQSLSGSVSIHSPEKGYWISANAGDKIVDWDSIETGESSEINLSIPSEKSYFRLKENSKLKMAWTKPETGKFPIALHLEKGGIMVLSDKKGFDMVIPMAASKNLTLEYQNGAMEIDWNPEIKTVWGGMLKGRTKLKLQGRWKSWMLSSLQKFEINEEAASSVKVEPLSRKEWNRLQEIYELSKKAEAENLKRQLDLSFQAGTFFESVFDHGTFYSPNFGYATREFVRDEANGEVHLEMEYDVYPRGSLSGIYFKMRNVHVEGKKTLELKVKAHEDEPIPQEIRLELKSGTKTVRAVTIQDIKNQWTNVQFPLEFRLPLDLTEMTLVFSHEKVGEVKRGVVDMKDFKIV